MAQWGGRTWRTRTPRPRDAARFAALTRTRGNSAAFAALDDLLAVLLPDGERAVLDDGLLAGELPADVLGLVEAIVQAQAARPVRAVASLSAVAVSSWTQIRGTLIRAGVCDPMRDLPSLWALLDAVESMILESKDDKGREAYLRDMYPATGRAGTRGWSDSEEAAAFDAFLSAH